MIFYNGQVFTGEGFTYGGFSVEDGRFLAVLPGQAQGDVDLGGCLVLPGLVDVHTHGNSDFDFSDGELSGLTRMAEYLASCGVTSFCPTSMTVPYAALRVAFETAAAYAAAPSPTGARLMGVHMEGPFFSEKKKGAQNAAYLQLPDVAAFEMLYRAAGGRMALVDVAPELPGAEAFTRAAAARCAVSVAHTDATYEQACAVFDAGATHLTHLFNAMPSIHHRNPGVIPAAAERPQVMAELIGDGQHVHPSVVRLAFAAFPERICLISDALRCCGMPEGDYLLGGLRVHLKDRLARLDDGTLAGSAVTLWDCLQNVIRFGVPAPEAIRAATVNPARSIGKEAEIGSIAPGRYADFVCCTAQYELQRVYLGGAPR